MAVEKRVLAKLCQAERPLQNVSIDKTLADFGQLIASQRTVSRISLNRTTQ